MDGWLETANCKNRSEFISKALRFYMGYLATDDVSSYVCDSVSQNIRGMLAENANRISRLMFKWSVELNMMMHIVAAHFKDDISDLRALRGYSADEVKRTYILQTNRSSVLLLLTLKPFSAVVEKGLFHPAGTSALPVTTVLPYAAMSGMTMPREKAALPSALFSGTTA